MAGELPACGRWVGTEGPEGHVLHSDVLGDEQLPLAGAGLHVQVAVVDEQHLQEVLGELRGPGHVQPRPQELRGETGRGDSFGVCRASFGEEVYTLPGGKLFVLTSVLC